MKEGYIKLSRNLTEHWLWSDEPFDKARAWIDLLFLANWEDQRTAYKGEVIVCKRGDVNFSISYLAKRWKWSRHKVSDFLDLLEKDNMLEQKRTVRRSVLTIVNYDVYQLQPSKKDSKRTANRTDSGQIADTIKEIKEIKEKKYIYGEYQNVRLTESEFEKLKAEFPADYQERIENLSFYMYNRKKTYTDHLATIRNWARRDGGKPAVKKNSFNDIKKTDYDFEELEKLLGG